MSKRLRVCIVAESYYPVVGGMERQVRTLADGLKALDIGVFVVTLRARQDLARREILDGVEVHRVAREGAIDGPAFRRWCASWSPSAAVMTSSWSRASGASAWRRS